MHQMTLAGIPLRPDGTLPPLAGGDPENEENVAPEAAPPVPAPEPTPAPASTAPWDADLASIVPDDEIRSKVGDYLREQWQPRMTKLEQDLAGTKHAQSLYNDFNESPMETFLAVGQELFGPEVVEQLQGILDTETPAATEPPADDVQGLDPRVQQMVDAFENYQQEQAYRQQLDAVKERDPELQEELFHPFVMAAQGDFDAAHTAYQTWIAKAREALANAPVVDPPPTALGTGDASQGTPAPPVAEKYDSIDAALDATLADMRAQRAPATVGAV